MWGTGTMNSSLIVVNLLIEQLGYVHCSENTVGVRDRSPYMFRATLSV